MLSSKTSLTFHCSCRSLKKLRSPEMGWSLKGFSHIYCLQFLLQYHFVPAIVIVTVVIVLFVVYCHIVTTLSLLPSFWCLMYIVTLSLPLSLLLLLFCCLLYTTTWSLPLSCLLFGVYTVSLSSYHCHCYCLFVLFVAYCYIATSPSQCTIS